MTWTPGESWIPCKRTIHRPLRSARWFVLPCMVGPLLVPIGLLIASNDAGAERVLIYAFGASLASTVVFIVVSVLAFLSREAGFYLGAEGLQVSWQPGVPFVVRSPQCLANWMPAPFYTPLGLGLLLSSSSGSLVVGTRTVSAHEFHVTASPLRRCDLEVSREDFFRIVNHLAGQWVQPIVGASEWHLPLLSAPAYGLVQGLKLAAPWLITINVGIPALMGLAYLLGLMNTRVGLTSVMVLTGLMLCCAMAATVIMNLQRVTPRRILTVSPTQMELKIANTGQVLLRVPASEVGAQALRYEWTGKGTTYTISVLRLALGSELLWLACLTGGPNWAPQVATGRPPQYILGEHDWAILLKLLGQSVQWVPRPVGQRWI